MKEESAQSRSEVQLVVFDLATELYGVDISTVREIIRMQNITLVPGTYTFVEGVINLRGKVIPVIDLRKRLSVSVTDYSKDSRIIIIELQTLEVGIIVDAVSEVLRIATSAIEQASAIVTHASYDYLWGVAKLPKELIILLEPSKLLSRNQIEQLDHESLVKAVKAKVGKKEKTDKAKSVKGKHKKSKSASGRKLVTAGSK
jgi:purine-binding chemotaxis protein CheW